MARINVFEIGLIKFKNNIFVFNVIKLVKCYNIFKIRNKNRFEIAIDRYYTI